MPSPWAPMIAPPLIARNDLQFNTCEHGYPAEGCTMGDYSQGCTADD